MSLPSEGPPRIVILGCGNPSRGDDALGPALMERLETWLTLHPERPVEAVQDFQFQVEHTLDLQGRDLVLFVDAAATGPDPYTFQKVVPAQDHSVSTHALSPAALLQAYQALDCGQPPAAFSLGVRGHGFELGEDLSPKGRVNLETAWIWMARLLEAPSIQRWDELATPIDPKP